MTEAEIIQRLQAIKANALALYSNFHVSAIVETDDGELYEGFNIESSSYGLTICAERVAIFKALSEGERKFRRVYVMSDGDMPCPPCGACRQVLMDYAPDAEIVMFSEEGEKKVSPLKSLLPYAFDDSKLRK